jgi:serine protease Do
MARVPLALLLTLTMGSGDPALAQQRGTDDAPPSGLAAGVFRRFSDRVVKIEVLEGSSAAKATLGTAFYADSIGLLITNYHVVARQVQEPRRYRLEITDSRGRRRPVRLLALDVIHDLAVLMDSAPAPAFFPLATVQLEHGERLFSLGHPRDLGLSIVEGTYNGLLQHTLYPKINFTGSLNPGMSGGPALDRSGRVVGVNVATMGEQLSFLVPVDRAIALLERVRAMRGSPPASFLREVGQQVHRYQDAYLRPLFTGRVPHVAFGPFRVPTEPAGFFKCWADVGGNDELPYEITFHRCSTDDEMYLIGDNASGVVTLEHRLLEGRRLNRFQFAALYSYQFSPAGEDLAGDPREQTRFVCETRNVRGARHTVRAALCVRRYRRFPGLYDAELRTAILAAGSPGLVSVLSLSGVSFANAQLLTRRYLTLLTAGGG